MNVDELKTKLREAGISEHAYSLFGDGLGECYVLTVHGKQWLVYYAERGQRQGLQSFESESEACQYLLEKLLSDPTTRKK